MTKHSTHELALTLALTLGNGVLWFRIVFLPVAPMGYESKVISWLHDVCYFMPTLEQIWPPLDWHSYEANNTLSLTTPRQECPAMCSDLLLYPCTAPHTNMNICLRQPGFLSVCSSAKRNLSLNFDYCSSASSRLDQSPRLASLGGDFSFPQVFSFVEYWNIFGP